MNMERPKKYIRNGITIDEANQEVLSNSTVCVLGCGGLGGYSIEMLARAGVGRLILVDGDTFDETNLNRQLLSSLSNLGRSKARIAKEHIEGINPDVDIVAVEAFINHHNGIDILSGCDLVIDALDSITSRKMVAKMCSQLEIPFVYGAIAGWFGQVATILPNDNTLDLIYPSDQQKGDEIRLGNPSFTPALVASIQVSEAMKVLLSKGELLTGGFMHIDLLSNDMEKIKFQ